MPRANRYVLPGRTYHLTHRCHDRQFLLRFAKDRDGYRHRLREAAVSVGASLLTYNIARNHVHLLAYAVNSGEIAELMQQAAGEFARDYNQLMGRRKRNRLLDQEKLLWLLRCEDPEEFRKQFDAALAQTIIDDELKRQAKWTEAIAVGDRAYIEAIGEQVQGRQHLRVEQQSGSWTLQERYGSLFEAEKSSLRSFEPSIPL